MKPGWLNKIITPEYTRIDVPWNKLIEFEFLSVSGKVKLICYNQLKNNRLKLKIIIDYF